MTRPSDEFRRTHEAELKAAAAAYKRAKARADQILAEPRQKLADAIRAAYASGNGLRKADIIRASDHVWSRQWIDETVRSQPEDQQ